MIRYDDFDEAANHLFAVGGSMNYDGKAWCCGSHEDIAEMVNDGDAKAATIEALRRGGWTEEAIRDEMRDYQG